MAKLTKDDVLKLAALAKLELTESEVEEFQTELSEILGYVEVLQKADVSGLKPTYQVTGITNAMRDDKVIDYGVSQSDLLKNVPDTENGQIKVKRVL